MFRAFGYISGFLGIVGLVPYIRDILLLKTKPERASWFIWLVLGGIAFASQLAKGATDSLWFVGTSTAAVLIVALLSVRYGVGGFTRRDGVALAIAGSGLVVWYFTDEAVYALFIVIAVDAIGSLLTFLKACRDPETETVSAWFLSGTAGFFALLAVGSWNPILLAYPAYIMTANYLIVGALLWPRTPASLHLREKGTNIIGLSEMPENDSGGEGIEDR